MNRFIKVLIWTIAAIIIVVGLIILGSPYGKSEGFSSRLVKHTVHIKAPADSVFRFLGNSGNAQQWSVFVHHISLLNPDRFPDGMPGSRRRCFCREDEKGALWDETLIEVIPGLKRQIICYDYKGFPMSAEGIATEQLYESLQNGSCNLTFTFFIKDKTPGLFESFKLYLGSYKLYDIFKRNLENIKEICEGKSPIHPRE